MRAKHIGILGIFFVLSAVILGISQLDSPKIVREKKMDRIRSERLWSAIQATNEYTVRDGKAPTSTDSFAKYPEFDYSRSQFVDPETNEKFTYTVNSSTFSWCATFAQENKTSDNYYSMPVDAYGRLFQHAAGFICFESSIPKAEAPLPENSLQTSPLLKNLQ